MKSKLTVMAACASLASSTFAAQQIERLSSSTSGLESNDSVTRPASSSHDGRFVVFTSLATNLDPLAAPGPGLAQVYLRDRALDTTRCVSSAPGGQHANSHSNSGPWALSADGTLLAFWTDASNYGHLDANNESDVFVRDLRTDALTLVSAKPDGTIGVGFSVEAALSGDGAFVAFSSSGPNLVAGDSNHRIDVFVRDLAAATTTRVSVSSIGTEGNAKSHSPALSFDGRFVVFHSEADNLVAGDHNERRDVFLHDRATATTTRVSVDNLGLEGNGESSWPSISADGRWIAMMSSSLNFGAPLVPNQAQVFVHDTLGGTMTWVSDVNGQVEGTPSSAVIAASGRHVVYTSNAVSFGGSGSVRQTLVRDLASGTTTLVSADVNGTPSQGFCLYPQLSGDGRFAFFNSQAPDLVAGDTNGRIDLFAHEGPWTPHFESYCPAGTSSQNCTPSLTATGLPSASAATAFTLSTANVDGQRAGLYFYGVSGATLSPWGQSSSWLCVKAPTQRTAVQTSGGTPGSCDGSLILDWSQFAASNPNALGAPFQDADTVWIQAWYRDPSGAKSTALSNALRFQLLP